MLNQPGFNSAYLMLFLAPLFWGGAFVAAKYVVPELHPLVAASLRFLISFLVLLPVLLIREKGKALPAVRDWPLLVLLGLTGVFAYNAFFFYGIGSTAATDGALIVASSPILTALLSAIFLGERFTGRQVLGFILSILGVLNIVTKGDPAVLLTWDVNTGDLLFFGCALSWACYFGGRKKGNGQVDAAGVHHFRHRSRRRLADGGRAAALLVACDNGAQHRRLLEPDVSGCVCFGDCLRLLVYGRAGWAPGGRACS